ncbi:MAG TPA: phosphotransferase [Fibrobacteria bacterium]|nr:phosphotransferase [Fibrobacteria bacterium]HOX50154.1 phosphotransferase [Fibrobacteria bacterium]
MSTVAPVVVTPVIASLLERLGHRGPLSPTIAGSAGSGRAYWRIATGDLTHIVLQSHEQDADYDRFLSITRHLRDLGLRVPMVFGSDDPARQVVLEDLGSTLLLSQAHALGFPGSGDPESLRGVYLPALEALARWQAVGPRAMEGCTFLSDRVFDLGPLLWETSYFARRCAEECFGLPSQRLAEPALLAEFAHLALRVEAHPRNLMHRDFQSQNLMRRTDGIWFIDYQGARGGSRWYDLASLLWDPYVDMPMALRARLFADFLELAGDGAPGTSWTDLLDAALQRVMQALGAYGFLSRHKELPWFSQFLEPGLRILRETLLERGGHPALLDLVEELLAVERPSAEPN